MWARFKGWLHSARSRETSAYDTYSRIVAYPLFFLSLMFLVAFAITLTSRPDAAEVTFARIVMPLTWTIFAIDYAIGILISPDRRAFVTSHLTQAVALIFPPLRVLMLYHIFQVLRAAPIGRGDRARVYVLYATTLLLVLSSLLVVYFERQSPESNINSFGNALWWAGETVSTVGYGDFFPVTVPGRLVAGLLFVNGVALVGVITAGLAQNFTNEDRQRAQRIAADAADAAQAARVLDPINDDEKSSPPDSDHVTVNRSELAEIHNRLAGLEQMLEQMADHVAEALTGTVSVAPKEPDEETDPRRARAADPDVRAT